MSRTLAALRRIEARGLPLSAPMEAPMDAQLEPAAAVDCEHSVVESIVEIAATSLERAEVAVELAIDDYAWGAHRPIPLLEWSELEVASAMDAERQSPFEADAEAPFEVESAAPFAVDSAAPFEVDAEATFEIEAEADSQIDFEPQPDFRPVPERAGPAVAPIAIGRAANFECYRALRSSLMTRQVGSHGSVLLLAATSAAAGRGFSAASLAIALAELDLGEVLIVDPNAVTRSMPAVGGSDQGCHPWQQQLRRTTEPQVQILPFSAEFLTSAALHDVCLWDCLRERFRFVLLGPWLPSEPALSRIAASHDGALLLLGRSESQRAAHRALRQLTASGSRVLGCVVAA